MDREFTGSQDDYGWNLYIGDKVVLENYKLRNKYGKGTKDNYIIKKVYDFKFGYDFKDKLSQNVTEQIKQPKEVQILNYKHIISDNKTVVLAIDENNKVIGKGVAVCLPEDTFSEDFGFRLAKARALGDSGLVKKLLREDEIGDSEDFEKNMKQIVIDVEKDSIINIINKYCEKNKELYRIR